AARLSSPSRQTARKIAARPSCADRIDRRFAAENAGYIACTLGLQFVERLDRIEAGVRGEDHIVAADQRGILGERLDRDDVEAGATDLSGIERGNQRRFVDQRAAR